MRCPVAAAVCVQVGVGAHWQLRAKFASRSGTAAFCSFFCVAVLLCWYVYGVVDAILQHIACRALQYFRFRVLRSCGRLIRVI